MGADNNFRWCSSDAQLKFNDFKWSSFSLNLRNNSLATIFAQDPNDVISIDDPSADPEPVAEAYFNVDPPDLEINTLCEE
jgi:hypothetical protein